MRAWSLEATHHYAQIRAALERGGKPVGAMDMLIAAHVIAEDSVLVTDKARDFHRVPGLAVEEGALE